MLTYFVHLCMILLISKQSQNLKKNNVMHAHLIYTISYFVVSTIFHGLRRLIKAWHLDIFFLSVFSSINNGLHQNTNIHAINLIGPSHFIQNYAPMTVSGFFFSLFKHEQNNIFACVLNSSYLKA